MENKKKCNDHIIAAFEKLGYEVWEYKEDNLLCGYELSGYTNRGGNMIHLIDFRNTNKNPYDIADVKTQFLKYWQNVDIDYEITINIDAAKKYGLTIRELVYDYENYYEQMGNHIVIFGE